MEFDFPKQEGTGVAKLLTFVSPDAQEIIVKLLTYDHTQRMSAGQALRHNYFKDLREQDKTMAYGMGRELGDKSSENPRDWFPGAQAMRLTHRGADSFSNQSKSMSKISDNVSEGSQAESKKKAQQQFRHTKQGQLGPNSSVGGISDLKIEGGKTQTFHSDVDET